MTLDSPFEPSPSDVRRDRVAVMRRGSIVEQDRIAAVLAHSQHDDTRALLDSIPGRTWTPPVLAGGA